MGLVMVKVRILVPPTVIGLGANDLTMAGGAAVAVNVSVPKPVDVVLIPALLEIKLLVLSNVPTESTVTYTSALHVPGAPPGMVPFEKESVVSPSAGLNVAPHVLVGAAGVVETLMPAGKASVKETEVRSLALGLARSKVSKEVSPTLIVAGEKDLESSGKERLTQPVNLTLSSITSELGLEFCASYP